MGAQLYGSYIHDVIDLPQFHYDRVHTIGTDFDDNIFMTIDKDLDEEDNDEFHNAFHNEEGYLKVRVTESIIV